ncbi:carboxypeptidase M32 [Aneurinibacillus terranovensis]|uniref:carboxypeptidase M32 n=1 Tax=Aneurinibacillus terranovensis TaxID=278991 RepID=UPI000401299A|nr:carboxypeptidase M32 [Aneurinibacillus terranovensis]
MAAMTHLSDSVQKSVQQFKELDQKISHYTDILGLMGWDLQTGAPKKGRELFSKAKGTLSQELFNITVSEEMGRCLETLSSPEVYDQLDEVTRACVRERKHAYSKFKKIPPDLYKEFIILTSDAHSVWENAKANNDFAHYQPTLEKIVSTMRKFIECYGYEGHPYNALLDDYEPGLTVEKLDPLFASLRESTIRLLQRIQKAGNRPKTEALEGRFAPEKQREFSLHVLPKLGFDMDAGRLDESAHPFSQTINTGDVRITTHYLENNVFSAILSTIHECGHALYEQGINPEYEGTVIREGASMGVHESQSRFLENMVGRSFEFWKFFYADLQSYFPEPFGLLPVEDFHRAINAVEPSFIRTEADELTYNLHIMIRYEIEKGLMAGEMEVRDLPRIWNEKMQEYLGITPPDDAHGVLQDVHWSFGGFGYFPSYSLGNLYAAQILHTLKQEMPGFYGNIAKGEFAPIRQWLKENIHQYGKLYTPNELIKKVTGEELNAKYLVSYLEDKFSKIYNLT